MKYGYFNRRQISITILLFSTLLITGILAYYAFSSTKSQQKAVNTALESKAQYASWTFNSTKSSLLNSRLSYFIRPVSENIHQSDSDEYIFQTTPAEVNDFISDYECSEYSYSTTCDSFKDIEVRSIFYLRENPKKIKVNSLDGEKAEKEFTAWLEEYLTNDEDHSFLPNRIILTTRITDSGEERLLVFSNTEQWPLVDHSLIAGYEFDIRMLGKIMEGIWQSDEVLPAPLEGYSPKELALDTEITSHNGTPIFSSDTPPDDAIVIENAIGENLSFIDGSISVHAEDSPDFMVGGISTNRITLLGILFALAAGLSIVAFIQFRREAELARIRSQFVSNVSHELRTPVTQIRMFAETLLTGRIRSQEEADRALEIIHQESQRLGHLINNVLDFSRSDRTQLPVQKEVTNLDLVVNQTLDAFEPIAQSGKSTISRSISPVMTHTDPSAIRQILLNLLDNAIKYGRRNQTIRVELTSDDRNVMLRVDDEGPGIPENIINKIWEPYWRYKSNSNSRTGSGIGLSVVAEYVNSIGGGIRVENLPERGSRFELQLPHTNTEPHLENRHHINGTGH